MPKVHSRAQARFYGAIAGGAIKLRKFPRYKARNALRGKKLKSLPARVPKRKTRRQKRR